MGLLHKKRQLSSNNLGTLYECLFPEYIVRFTIFDNNVQRVECWFWNNDGYNNRTGDGHCLRAFLGAKDKAKSLRQSLSQTQKIGKGYDTFEEADVAWTDFYNSAKE